MRITRVALAATMAIGLSACGAPVVTPLTADIHAEDDGIQGMRYDAGELASLAIEPGSLSETIELAPVPVTQPFDRVNVRWEAITGGGVAALEVSPDGSGQWFPVTIDFEEFVAESGVTLYTGHADLPVGSQSIQGRVLLERAEADGASPQLLLLEMEVFVLADVSEAGDPTPPGPDEESDDLSMFAVGAPAIVTREQWGARAPKCSGSLHTPSRLTFHHTVTPNGETGSAAKARQRAMQAFHIDGRGWCDLGYHFTIDGGGTLYRGRITTARTGSHVGGQNTGNIGISLMGTYDSVTPSTAVLGGLMDAFAWMADIYDIPATSDRIRGHREWPGQSTSCPGGKTFAQKSVIIAGVADRLNGTTPPPPPPPGADTVIIDNPSTAFAASQSWWTSTSQTDRYGANYRVRAAAAVSDTAEWKAALETRDYEVFVWYSQGANRSSAAPYFVHHKNGSTKKLINQQANGGRWVSLGTYSFAGGTATRVGLSCWTSGQYVIADAVKFVPK